MRRLGFAIVVIALTQAAAASALQKPSFSGTWIIQPPNKAAGMEQVVRQDDKTLSIITGGRTMTHQLDGVEHREARSMRGGEVVMISKAAWEGRTIVITIATSYPNDMKTISKEIWSIDDRGQLVIDFTETAQGSALRTMKVTHKKKS